MTAWVELGLAAALAAASVALRLAPVLGHGEFGGADAAYHRWYIGLIRANGGALPETDPRVLGPGTCTYPALFHWLLARLPPAAVDRFGRFGGLAMDAASGAAIALAAAAVSPMPHWTVVVIGALHLIAPALTFSFIGPRAFSLTPRAFAQTAYTVAVLPLVLGAGATGVPAPLVHAVSVAALAAALLSAKFALQHVLFTAPVAALAGFPELLFTALAAALVAQAASRGFFLRQIRGHLDHLVWYWRLNRHFVSARGDWKRLLKAISAGDLRVVTSEMLVQNAVIVGVVRNLPSFVAIGLAARAMRGAPETHALALTLAAVIPWLATSFGALRVLGEPERYLEYAWPTGWLLLWTTLGPGARAPAALLLTLFFVGFYLANLTLIARHRRRYPPGQREPVLAALRDAGDAVVLPLDIAEMPFLLAETRARVVGPCCQHSLRGEGAAYFPWFFSRFPFVSATNLPAILHRYEPDYLLLTDAARAAAAAERPGGYDLAGFVEVAASGPFRLLRRLPGAASPP